MVTSTNSQILDGAESEEVLALGFLRKVFGKPKEEGLTTTARVLNLPSGVTKDLASQAIEQLDLTPVMRDIGIIVAREISNTLEAMSLRPSDYTDLPDLAKVVAARVGSELSTAPDEFAAALIDHLNLRG